MLKYHTFYLINGLRLVFLGVDFQDAYCNNQSYTDGLRPIQIQKEGIDDGHYWDVDQQLWIEKRSLVIQEDQALSNLDSLRTTIIQQLPLVSEIIIKEPNSNILRVSLKWSQWVTGWLKTIEISYGECESEPGQDLLRYPTGDEGYYSMLGTEYFNPEDIERVAEIFADRLTSVDRFRETGNGSTIDRIMQQQSLKTIYTNLTDKQELRLLGQLTLRLSQQEEPSSYTPLLTNQVRYYTKKLLTGYEEQLIFAQLFSHPSLTVALLTIGD